ncbi:MAG: membrane protein [Bacteroidia bacterium]|nr:MAG: membrane protein [Bacteroidia bacterium]
MTKKGWGIVGYLGILGVYGQAAKGFRVWGFTDVPGGEVRLLPAGKAVQADSVGNFVLEDVPPGLYRIQLRQKQHLLTDTVVRVPMEGPVLLFSRQPLHPVVIEAHVPQASHLDLGVLAQQPEKPLAAHLATLPGVQVSHAGPWLQKPMLEGLRGTRLAYWQGALPLASQQWGDDHAPELDPFAAEEVEVRVGPSPVRHGPEAAGGAILIPFPSLCCLRPLEVQTLGSLFSNGRGGLAALRLRGTWHEWGYQAQGTFLRSGALAAPDYFLTGTATRQYHGSLAVQRTFRRWRLALAYNQYNAQIGLFQGMHVGNLSDLMAALQASTPRAASVFSYAISAPFQAVTHETAQAKLSYLFSHGGLLSFSYGRQYNRRTEHDAQGLYAPTGVALDLQLTDHYTEITYEHRGWTLGALGRSQRNYRQYAYFIPSYQRWEGGLYAYRQGRRWEGGLRLQAQVYEWGLLVTPDGPQPPGQKQAFWVGGAELRRYVQLDSLSRTSLEAAWLLRPPNPAELYAYGYHQAKGAFEIGSSALRPEPLGALRFVYERPDGQILAALYYSPAYVLAQVGPPVLSLRGAALSLQYFQAPAGWVSLSARQAWTLPYGLQAVLRGTWLYGRHWSSPERRWRPLPLWPGPIGALALGRSFGRWSAEVSWQAYLRPLDYDPSAEYTPPPRGYSLLNAQITWQHGPWILRLSGENLLDARYRAYPDLMRFFADQVGRQVRFTMEYRH